jgi:HEAT repeat protein
LIGDGLFAVLMVGFFVSWLLRAERPPTKKEPPMWETVARGCGLDPLGAQTFTSGTAHPTPDLRVQVAGWWGSGGDPIGTMIAVQCVRGSLAGVGLRPENKTTALAKRRGAREVVTGDDAFDDAFYVSGPDAWMRAVLDDETRRLLMSLRADAELDIVNGELHGRVMNHVDLGSVFRAFLTVAHRLRRPADLPAALVRRARSDAHAGVRREAVLALARDFPTDTATRATLRAACDDPSDEVRVRAAIALGPEGRATLLAVAKAEPADDAAAARALAELGPTLPAADTTSILKRALAAGHAETARACLDTLTRQDPGGAVPVLAQVLARENGELAAVAARALGATGQAAAEPSLLAALDRDAPVVRVAAAHALGLTGSVSAVLPLKDLERRSRDDATRKAAREAVAAIQSRLPGASPGQLSLPPADAGALSVADDETGRLTLDDPTRR